MTSQQSFIDQIFSVKTAEEVRAVHMIYADWLDDEGEHLQAARQRVLGEPYKDKRRLEFATQLEMNGERDWAEYIRGCLGVTLKLSPPPRSYEEQEKWLEGMFIRDHEDEEGPNWKRWADSIPADCLMDRKGKLIGQSRAVTCGIRFKRGMVNQVTISWSIWSKCGDDVYNSHPISKVTLTTVPPVDMRTDEDNRLAIYTLEHPTRGRVRFCRSIIEERQCYVPQLNCHSLLARLWPGIQFEIPR